MASEATTRPSPASDSVGLLRQAVETYLSLLSRDLAGTTARLARAVREHELVDPSGPPLTPVLRPRFMFERDYRLLMKRARLLNRALFTAAAAVQRDAALRRRLAYPRYLEELVAADGGRGGYSVIGRFDALIGSDGEPAFIEYNSEPHGMNEYFELGAAFAHLPLARTFRQRWPFRTVSLFGLAARTVQKWLSSLSETKATLGVVRISSALAQEPSFRHLAYAAARGCRIVIGPAEAYRWSGSRLTLDGDRIDAVALLDWSAFFDQRFASSPLFVALRAGAVRVLNGLSLGLLCSYKHTLELLSDDQWSAELASVCSRETLKFVAWTRVLRETHTTFHGRRIDLLPYVVANQDAFVVKPSGGTGGRDILFGDACSPAEWNQAIRRGIGTHVVQERQRPAVESYPLLNGGEVVLAPLQADCNPFVWNGEHAAGCSVRASAGNTLNRAQGAMPLALWVLRDPPSPHVA
jgi:hypothetical protein